MSNRQSLGMRRDRIVFQTRRRLAKPDAQGRIQEEWQDITPQIYTDLIPLRSGEQVMAGRLGGVSHYSCKPLYHPSMEVIAVGDRAVDLRSPLRALRVASILIGPERDFADIVLTAGVAS